MLVLVMIHAYKMNNPWWRKTRRTEQKKQNIVWFIKIHKTEKSDCQRTR